jgi:hypothetical protein
MERSSVSLPLLARSADLQRLQDEGYEVHIRAGFLIVTHVPYVTPAGTVAYGALACSLNLAGDTTSYNHDHTVWLQGEVPCDRHGQQLRIIAGSAAQTLLPDFVGNHYLSSKPDAGYRDYHDKLTRYIAILGNPARSLDPTATAQTFIVVNEEVEPDSVFLYQDTASSRAGITVLSSKLALPNVAIVGLGGTGSYVLDLLAKTHVERLHLFDGDVFSQHNSFRAPAARSLAELQEQPLKVTYFAALYGVQRRGIVPHGYYLDERNVDELRDMSFVFLCMEGGAIKRMLVERLEAYGVPFIDVGLGVSLVAGDQLLGQVRVTTSSPGQRKHVWEEGRIPFPVNDEENQYDQNIQIADLNMLNASLAVIKWKKLMNFYADTEREHYAVYAVDGNNIVNEVLA